MPGASGALTKTRWHWFLRNLSFPPALWSYTRHPGQEDATIAIVCSNHRAPLR